MAKAKQATVPTVLHNALRWVALAMVCLACEEKPIDDGLCRDDQACDDGSACTADQCLPNGLCSHAQVKVNDHDVCTTDSCDAKTGAKHLPVALDDGDACTVDSCDATRGVTHAAIEVDDHNGCTIDSCDRVSGVSHVGFAIDDHDACTNDVCDAAGGVSHPALDLDDHDACTIDACDAVSGPSHVMIDPDDHDVCTIDSCDAVLGVLHVPITPASDGVACTDDVCNPTTGVQHVPVNARCELDGRSCTVAACSAISGCSETVTDSVCDDGVACNVHQCLGAAGDSNGCAPKTGIDARCGPLQVCRASGCAGEVAADQRGAVIISELSVLGAEVIELKNTTGAAIDVHGFLLRNLADARAEVRAVTDLNGANGTPVVIPANGEVYGVKNPVNGAPQAGAAFVYGAAGTTFSLNDTGDALSLYSGVSGAKLEDTVNFSQLVTDPNVAPGAAFVAFTGATSQADPTLLTATGNDPASAWCVSFGSGTGLKKRRANTLGAPNGSCAAVVINEVFFQSAQGDDGRTYVELAGPGGADVSGYTIADLSSDGGLIADGDFGVGEVDGLVRLPAGTRLPADGYLIIADATSAGSSLVANVTPGVDLLVRDIDLADGPGSVQLISATGGLVDVVGHDPASAALESAVGFNGLATFEGSVAKTPPVGQTLARAADNADTDFNSNDFRSRGLTPGKLNKVLGASLSVHLTLGQPDFATVDVSTPDKYLSVKPQYVVSYNGLRKNPNYTALELNASWKGTAARQDTFRSDDTLPLSISQATLSDYSSSGWTRGHMCASDDRDVSIVDNSSTFYLTNMVPQAANNNSGPWQKLEAYLQCLAVVEGKEIFIAAGGLYEGATKYTKIGSTVQVPTHTWKVVTVLGAPGQGVSDVTAATRSFAVVMINDDALITPSAPWRAFRVSVREVEARTGYDFNADVDPLIQDAIEAPIDSVSSTCTCMAGLTCAGGTY